MKTNLCAQLVYFTPVTHMNTTGKHLMHIKFSNLLHRIYCKINLHNILEHALCTKIFTKASEIQKQLLSLIVFYFQLTNHPRCKTVYYLKKVDKTFNIDIKAA